MKHLAHLWATAALLTLACTAGAQQWPTPTREAKPGSRWWWLGSAVDRDNLRWNIGQYAGHGIGALEITPLYSVQDNEQRDIDYLSDKWMQMLRYTQELGREYDVEIDMATGTGWPFGGPWVPLGESASKMVFVDSVMSTAAAAELEKKKALLPLPPRQQKNATLVLQRAYAVDDNNVRVIALYAKYGIMAVKRAAPGGEGLVIDHFDREAVGNYLRHIEAAFERTGTPYPHTFFNDSYEVADATWTPKLFEEFEKRRGYQLQAKLPELIDGDVKVVSDYRETLADLLLENFTEQWTAWAHSHGAITRNQAHGSPANLIDCYAAVDIPEIEGFGLSDFGIKGLRKDPGKTRKNDSDYSMFKYAPSAAHVCGKPYTSSETFTWLTEHFRTSLSQLKPDIDLMFCAGVNHMFFHGTAYSPKDDAWPGWKFYASIDMSPTNSIWRDAPYFMQYVERCQSFLQWGQPDNDFLVLLPVRDMWKKNTRKLLMQFSIHAMSKLAPEFIETILAIDRAGFDCDYISERLLMGVSCSQGQLVTAAGTRYRGLIIPGSGEMPDNVRQHIERLKEQGAHICYSTDASLLSAAATPEAMKTRCSLKAIRRKNATGHHYFIANLTPDDIKTRQKLAVSFNDAYWFNPLNGNITRATFGNDGIDICLRSGESMILQTYDRPMVSNAEGKAMTGQEDIARNRNNAPTETTTADCIRLDGPWTLSFTEEAPRVDRTFRLDKLQTWETLADDSARVTMGTGIYTTRLKLSKQQLRGVKAWRIDLGDVRESARVYVNGHFVGCAWSVPFSLQFEGLLKKGSNTICIEVTNLPANRISDLDRRGVKWRKMKEINVVDINYKKTLYDQWDPMPSGLNSQVTLTALR
ncbi:MAG: glycosyl hydrolase family 2 [Prevotella sp.]|nr:glycosyl hydrolase family 2 [Prevotella sp.]